MPYNSMQYQMGLMPQPIFHPPPQVMHPGQASQQLRTQAQWQAPPMPQMGFGMGTSMSPVARPMGMTGMPMMGPQNWAGRQQVVQSYNQDMARLQAGVGFGARMMSMGALGPVGGMIGEWAGLGQAAQNFGNNLVQPLIQNRANMLGLQTSSMNFIRGGVDAGAGGFGLSHSAANSVNMGLNRMSNNRDFQMDTQNMFNRNDLQKITSLASQLGMMDQAQNSKEIVDSVGKISRALKTFMDVTGEPDFQEAMKRMGELRQIGMNLSDTGAAARNARTFSRMAGVSEAAIHASGLQGSAVFQRAGMAGATGYNVGMAARGFGGVAEGIMSPRALAMSGGAEGVAGAFTGAAARAASIEALLPAMLTRRNGRLAIDQGAIVDMISGGGSIQDLARRGASNISRLGGRNALMELSTRMPELQDEAMNGMGGTMGALLPLIRARSIMQSVPGMNLGGALRTMGLDQQSARTLERMGSSHDFYDRLLEQNRRTREEQRAVERERRERDMELGDRSELRLGAERFGRRMRTRLSTAVENFQEDFYGNEADVEEAQARLGGGRLLRSARRRRNTAIQEAGYRDWMRGQDANEVLNMASQIGVNAVGATNRAESVSGYAQFLPGMGPRGFGLSEAARGGQFLRTTVAQSEGTVLGGLNARLNMSNEEVFARAEERRGTAAMFARAGTRNIETRRSRMDQVNEAFRGVDNQSGALSRAAVAVNRRLSDSRGFFQSETVTQEQLRETVINTLVQEEGISREQAEQMANNSAVMDRIVELGGATRDEEANAAVAQIRGEGADINAQLSAMDTDTLRAYSESAGESALATMGFSDVSQDAARAIMDVSSGAGPNADLRRKMVQLRGLEIAGQTDERAAAAAVELRQQLEQEAGPEVFDREMGVVRSQLRDTVSEDELARAGSSLMEGVENIEDIGNVVSGRALQAGAGLQARGMADTAAGLNRLLGREGMQAFSQAGTAREKVQAIRSAIDAGTIPEEYAEQLETMINEGDPDEVAGQLAQLATAMGRDGEEIAVEGGSATIDELIESQGLEGALRTLEQDLTGGEGGGGGAATPQTFEEATSVFSEASAKLLEAAEEMNSGFSMGRIFDGMLGGEPNR